jgi:hypothetical protein
MRKPVGRKAAKPGVYAVTGVRSSLTDDVNGRQRRYALAMSIRTVCFLLCVVTPGPLRWAFFVGALVLPYVAVVIANGGRENGGPGPKPVDLPTRIELLPVRPENLPRES